MIESIQVKGFKAVPYLETSELMKLHGGKLSFSTTKPNVIVGPNGTGKSALVSSLALRHLAFFLDHSCLDGAFVYSQDSEPFWTQATRWGNQWTFLEGLNCTGDSAAALYYRPGHIPGNETGYAHAMMMGYMEQAREQSQLVRQKSSGQVSRALQARLMAALSGSDLPREYVPVNWRAGFEPVDLESGRYSLGSAEYKAEVLKVMFLGKGSGVPLILMDEPEQSLDALAEMRLWSAITQADCSKMQVIVATHSLYPLLHPEKFNLIETQPGYASQVIDLAQSTSVL